MVALPPALLALHDLAHVLEVLAFFGSFWLAVVVVAVTALLTWHWRKARESELGAQMIEAMLARKMTANEIERVVLAWSRRKPPRGSGPSQTPLAQ